MRAIIRPPAARHDDQDAVSAFAVKWEPGFAEGCCDGLFG
jgi:hypothetical protein